MKYLITDFGAATHHSAARNGKSIQEAIDTAASHGGGTVLVPPGRFETAHLRLRSHIRFELLPGAVLVGSKQYDDCVCSSTPYPSVEMMGIPSAATDTRWCALLYAEDEENIEICGNGTLEGQGMYYPIDTDPTLRRPMLLFFERCKQIHVSGLTLKNPSMYAFLASRSSELTLERLRVFSMETENGDGLDFNGCTDVIIRNCIVESGDDAISLKTTYPDYPCHNVLISGCILRAVWSGFRMGTESTGDMRDIILSDCVFERCSDGIKIQDCSSGIYENVRISNVSMRDVHRPVFMTINSFRLSKYDTSIRPPMGGIRDVVIDGLTAYMSENSGEYQRNCFVISGCPKKAMEQITLRNLQIVFRGQAEANSFERVDVPEFLDYSFLYADIFSINGGYPAAGMFLRHIHGLTMDRCRLVRNDGDLRPMLLGYDLMDTSLMNISAIGGGAFFQAEQSQIRLSNCWYGNQAAEVEAFPAHLQKKFAAFLAQTKEADLLLDQLSHTADLAQACSEQRTIAQSDWTITADTWQTNISLSPNDRWLLLVSYGDLTVTINGKKAGQCILPPLYRTLCAWAVDLHAFAPGNAEIVLHWNDPSDRGGSACVLPFGVFKPMKPALYRFTQICG